MAETTAITVLGAGSYGTALAVSLARSGHRTSIWGHEEDGYLEHNSRVGREPWDPLPNR